MSGQAYQGCGQRTFRQALISTHPGYEAGEHELTTLSWPLITVEDIQTLSQLPTGKAGRKAKDDLLKHRLLRLVKHGLGAPGGAVLLTLADLSLMTGLSTVLVSHYLSELRQETGKALPTQGYHFDQGRRPTHKRQVIELYESGVDEAAIARRTSHSQTSVGHYIRDYERVKRLLAHGTLPAQIPALTMLQPSVVRAYIELVTRYHPHLAPDGTGEP